MNINKISEITKAQTLAHKNKIKLGISNPCFELWYLLHFKYTTAYLKDYSSVKDILQKETPLKNYTKNKNVYDLLKDKTPNAIKNGIKLREYHEKDEKTLSNIELTKQNIKDIVENNPYTNIMDLVQYIGNLNHRQF